MVRPKLPSKIILTEYMLYNELFRQFRKMMSRYLGGESRTMRVEKILTLIVESGSLYIVLYVSNYVISDRIY